MTHYAHKHTITVRAAERCVPCDCYVCALDERREGVRESYRLWTECAVERVLEEIESQLVEYGETAVMRVWNALTGWTPGCNLRSEPWPTPSGAVALGQVLVGRPSLIGVVRGVFRSLDRHGLIEPARLDRARRRALVWREVQRHAVE